MSVVLEVTLPSDAFRLGSVLSTPTDVSVELARVVPVGEATPLYLWAAGPDRTAFERHVREDHRVEAFVDLDRAPDRTLYRMEWTGTTGGVVDAVRRSEAVVLDARLEADWLFRLRFPDDDRLSTFHHRCLENDLSLCVERVDRTDDERASESPYGLSAAQREALVAALERGYFATPSEVDLQELAEEFDVSHQALSSRIRRGLEAVLSDVLRSTVDDH